MPADKAAQIGATDAKFLALLPQFHRVFGTREVFPASGVTESLMGTE
jgi:hypothetical protein